MASIFPDVKSDQLQSAIDRLVAGSERLEAMLAGSDDAVAILNLTNDLGDVYEEISTFLGCSMTSNTADAEAQAALSAFENRAIHFHKVRQLVTRWMAQTDSPDQWHEFHFKKAKVAAEHLMTEPEEALAADLSPSSTKAWEKLYESVSSQVMVTVDGEEMSIVAARSMATDPDRAKRKAAYEAELAGWKTVETPLAASMNGIKGAVLTLSERRGWGHPLDQACFHANQDRATLDAMMSAARKAFPDFRRYWHAKAKLLSVSKLAFYDLFAPVGSLQPWSFEDGAAFVEEKFGEFAPHMRELAARSVRERWIDIDPRPGKVGGAFCAPLPNGDSRILLNFKPSFSWVNTHAHELGHAYHNLCLRGRTALQRDIPMTLAETASIFCETYVRRAAMAKLEGREDRLAMLDATLTGAGQTVVDITSRFDFESAVFAQRRERDLSAGELCEAMRQAQLGTYGEGLDTEQLHPYMWAAKPHYYSSESYYNFPYMFGLLFALGLYNLYTVQPEGFVAKYDDLLSRTGMSDAASLAAEFGMDIRQEAFWNGSLDQLRADIDEFVALVG